MSIDSDYCRESSCQETQRRKIGFMDRPRVVVTGLGIVCPTGNTVDQAWTAVKNGQSGIGPITRFDPSRLAVRIAGEVKGFDPVALYGAKDARRMDRVTHLALEAARQALESGRFE